LLSSILKTRLDEVYLNVFVALRVLVNYPNTVARRFSKTEADQNLQQVSYDR